MKISKQVLMMGAVLLVSLNLLYAQTAVQPLGGVPTASSDSVVQIAAEAAGLQAVAPADLPIGATYWWALPRGTVPMPFAPADDAVIFQVTANVFLVDCSGGVVASPRRFGSQMQTSSSSAVASEVNLQADALTALIDQIQIKAASRQMRSMAQMSGMGIPLPGGGGSGDGGGGDDYTNSYVPYTINTNQLYLELTNVAGGWSYLNLHSATNSVYSIWSTTNLLTPFSGWQVETELWPTGDQTNVLPFIVQNFDRQNLFFRALDWTGVDSDGDGIPDWWGWRYFGTANVVATNADYSGSGYTFADDYTYSLTPTVFKFTGVEVTNNYFASSPAAGQLDVAGSPYYFATLVDDGNFSNAVWNAYSGSNVTVNLGLGQGWHEVWIGLRGHADDPSAAVWQRKRLKLDWTPPALIITSPTNGTVAVPMIQLQGYSPEALASISYDLSNAAGTVTNQQVLVLNQYYDPATWEFTTNTFQAFDVALTNGVNTFTLHATDLAGNVTTLVTNFTLDYSAKTNPPNIQITWPQDGMKIAGNTVTVRGQVDDATVTVAAAITDTNGNTSTFGGVVERTGRFWLDHLPLHAGTNAVVITVTDAAGNVATNQLDLIQNDLVLTMDAVSDPAQELWQPVISVSGQVSDPAATIYVNGIQGTNNGDGTWSADNVTVTAGGVAIFDLKAVPAGGGDPDTSLNLDKPGRVFMVGDAQNLNATTDDKETVYENAWGNFEPDDDDWSSEDQTWINYNHVWLTGWGGAGSEYNNWQYDYWDWQTNHTSEAGGLTGDLDWDWTGWGAEMGINNDGVTTTGYTNALWIFNNIGNEHCNVSDPVNTQWDDNGLAYGDDGERGSQHDTYTRTADTVWHVQTGGRAIPGRQNLWQFSGSASEILNKRAVPAFGGAAMRAITNLTQIALGSLGSLKADGTLWLTLPDAVEQDVTPYVAAKDFYTFSVSGQEYPFYIGLTTSTVNADLSTDTPEVCVGQTVTLGADWQSEIPPYTNVDSIYWHLPDKYVNKATNYSTTCTTYVKDDNLLTNTVVQCWYVNGSGGACSVREKLYFANGQSVNIAAAGNFTVYRPSVNQPNSSGPFNASLEGSYPPMLELADNAMYFTVTINSKYPGNFGLTQLVKMYSETVLIPPDVLEASTTFGDFNLDINPDGSTGEYYDGPWPISRYCQINDPPGQPLWFFIGDYTGHWQDYVRFTPDGGIPVTLGRIDWDWAATAENPGTGWYITSDGVDGPSTNVDDSFPVWKNQGISTLP